MYRRTCDHGLLFYLIKNKHFDTYLPTYCPLLFADSAGCLACMDAAPLC
jgi:hypothetical protein